VQVGNHRDTGNDNGGDQEINEAGLVKQIGSPAGVPINAGDPRVNKIAKHRATHPCPGLPGADTGRELRPTDEPTTEIGGGVSDPDQEEHGEQEGQSLQPREPDRKKTGHAEQQSIEEPQPPARRAHPPHRDAH